MTKATIAGFITGAICLIIACTAQANLIVNGSFEDPDLSKSWTVYDSIPGWQTISGAGIEVQNNAAGAPYDGSQLVELDSYSNSSMEQFVDTLLDAQYTLEFAYSPRPNVASTSNSIKVYWNSFLLDTITGYTTGSTSWSLHSYTISGFGDATSLVFAATGTDDSLGGYLDAVSLNPVPEPATMLLFGTGLIGLAGLAFRKKK